jgi:uncharacterized protein YaiI (UPF0178 family)
MYIDTSHILNDGYSEIVTVDKGFNSVDIALINRAVSGDVIVTQDFGVAAMALGKKCYALNQNGMIYDKDNIDRLLFERHISQKVRKSGGKASNPRKRTKEDNERFERAFEGLIIKAVDN